MTGLDQLLTFPRFGTMGVNERMERLCDGMIQIPAIKIVGSNGKGTTAHMMAEMAMRLGKRVGLYTSPHLLKVNERIKVQGVDIVDDDLDRLLVWACKRARALDGVGRFEILTLAAIKHFADLKLDLAVMEVGLGGRFDPVRAASGTLSVLTSLDLEHTAILGNSLTEIATEKAAICRKGDCLISAVGGLEACVPDGVDYVDLSTPPLSPLQSNARLAAHALKKQFGLDALPETFGVKVPGRLQKIAQSPALYVDVAHSPAALKTVLDHFTDQPITLICAARNDKDLSGFDRDFHHVIALQVEADMHPAQDILKAFRADRKEVASDVGAALDAARRYCPKDGAILCVGGFGLVGRMIAHVKGLHYDVIRL